MSIRSILTTSTIALAALALAAGCDETKPSSRTTSGASTSKTAKTAASGKPTAKPTATATASAYGKGVIMGTVTFTGEAPEMKVPIKRKDAEVCKDTEVKYNAVLVADSKLQDVYVGIADEQLSGDYEAQPAKLDQKECMYSPRMQGVMVEQMLHISNSDATLHNVNAGKFNFAQPKAAPVQKKSFDEPGIVRFQCDVHPWMRAFTIVSDNPFYAVSGADGTFKIEKVPAGKYKVWAWHSQYGKKMGEVEVKDGQVKLDFEFDGTESEPAENKGELNGLF